MSLEKKQIPNYIPKNNLREIRILKNPKISQWVLSLKTGVSQSRISLIENLLVLPTKEECNKLASALDAKSRELFPLQEEVPFVNRQVNKQQSKMTGENL